MELDEICKALSVIHSEPHPVVCSLVNANPKNHFSLAFHEALQGELMDGQLKNKMFLKVDRSIKENLQRYESSISEFKSKTIWVNNYR